MPRPSLRSRSKKRTSLRLPGGRAQKHYKQKKTGFPRCSKCGRVISGVPRSTPSKLRSLPSSQRSPERIYGGQLCPSCLRKLLKAAVRST